MSTIAMPVKSKVRFTYQDYLIWDIGPDKRYELIGGEFFMVPAPNIGHQHISGEIEFKIRKFLEKKELGMVFDAPCDVILSNEDVVQPDIIFVSKQNAHIISKDNIKGSPDLLIEIISSNTKQRDKIIKRRLYEKYGIKEYWLVDIEKKEIEILVFQEGVYKSYGIFKSTDTLSSYILKDFCLKIEDVFKTLEF